MNPLIPTLALSGLTLLAGAAKAEQKVLPAQSEIRFVSRQMGVPVEGQFKRWDAQLAFDPKKPEAGKVSFTIETGSASFGSAETDAEVPKPEWLGVAKFPRASFQSTAMKSLGGGKFEVAGQLTLKGAVRPVVVPVAITQTAAQAGANTTAVGQFTIKRLDFKIGEGDWADTSMVANDVVVKFKLTVTGVAPL
jgi:polyisoprenoid-binding protein YceI